MPTALIWAGAWLAAVGIAEGLGASMTLLYGRVGAATKVSLYSNAYFRDCPTDSRRRVMSALAPEADISRTSRYVRYMPKADIRAVIGYYCWWARVLKFVEHHP